MQDAQKQISAGQSSATGNAVTALPRDCTFAESDWRALAPFWYPVAFSHEVKDKPFAAKLLDERLVVFRLKGNVSVARDLCLHRGAPLSAGADSKATKLSAAIMAFVTTPKANAFAFPRIRARPFRRN